MSETYLTYSARHIPELNGIRGLAILLVLVWHYVVCLIKAEPDTALASVMKAFSLTWSGVDLFFVLSGFLIGGILIDHARAPGYFKAFFIRRVCRIFPLYFLWLALFSMVVTGASSFYIAWRLNRLEWLFQDPLPLWSFATFTQNFVMASRGTYGPNWMGITWSLAVEEQFYLVLPFIIRFTSARWRPFILLAVVLATPVLRVALFFYLDYDSFTPHVLMPCRADALLSGVLCAYAVRRQTLVHFLSEHQGIPYAMLGLCIAGLLMMVYRGIGDLAMVSFGYSLLAAAYCCLLLIAVTEKRGAVTTIVRNRLLMWLGTIAYGVYIFHQAALGLLHAMVLHQSPRMSRGMDVAVTAAALVVTIIAAWLSWTFFEKWFVAVGHSFRYSSRHPFTNVSSV